ncbi:MAG TPA: hypothetical protein VN192_03890 [Flavobacterium sp.]|nr:hypothetical protein [Flavobacterium sp.]
MQTITVLEEQELGQEKVNKTLKLIDGVFTHIEAEEILMNFFKYNINFYKIKNWSSQERFGENDEETQMRLPELKNDIERLYEILANAKNQNKKLVISSEIKITFVDK